mgnify:CR=1 FL=1
MYKIFDIHTHIYPDAISERAVTALGNFYDFVPQGKGCYSDMTAHDKNYNISGFLVFSVATNAHQVRRVNEFLASTCKQAINDGFNTVAFGGLHQDCEDMKAEIDYALSLGLKGIKIHPDIQGIDVDDKRLYPLYEEAEGKFPIYFHIGDNRPQYQFSKPKKLRKILDEFPRLQVVAAHLGGWMMWEEVAEKLVGTPIYFDTAFIADFVDKSLARDIIRAHGADKVLFGSDAPWEDPAKTLEFLSSLDIDTEDFKKICGTNAAGLLGI